MKEQIFFKLEYSFSDEKDYIRAAGDTYLRRNKIMIISFCAFAVFCLTMGIMPLPIPRAGYVAVPLILFLAALMSYFMSYFNAFREARANREELLRNPCTLTMYDTYFRETSEKTGEFTALYSDVKQVVLTFATLSIVTKKAAIIIPIKDIMEYDFSDILTHMLSRGSNVSGYCITKAVFLDNIKNAV